MQKVCQVEDPRFSGQSSHRRMSGRRLLRDQVETTGDAGKIWWVALLPPWEPRQGGSYTGVFKVYFFPASCVMDRIRVSVVAPMLLAGCALVAIFGCAPSVEPAAAQPPEAPAAATESTTPKAKSAALPAAVTEAAAEDRQPLTAMEVFNEMLPSTAWIRVAWTDAQGNGFYRVGTGWVYDVGRHLVVTNEHVVHDFDELSVYFPESVDGELVHDPNYYLEKGQHFTATVIDRDTQRDLALLELDGMPDDAKALALAEKSPVAGERVFALAALPEGSEGLWIMTSGEVRQVYRRSHANNHFARVVETQLPTNRGNSGGAVVNDRLEVVAVVEGHMQEARLVSLFIDVGEICDYLDEAVPLVSPATAANFEARASRRFDEGRYDQAIADYTAALKLDPQLTSAMVNRGWAYLNKEDYETASADFGAALKIDPEMRAAYEGRGTCQREMGQYDQAIRDLTEAIRRDSADADGYERRAKCYQALERYHEALKDRNRAVELSPDEYVYLLGRGQTFRALKKFDAARRDFERAIALEPGRSEIYYELAYVYYDEQKYDQAELFFTMAQERSPHEPSYFNMRGMARLQSDHYDRAVEDFNAAINLAPDRSLYRWNLGRALWYLDRNLESAQAYSEYIRLEPNDPDGYKERAEVYDALGEERLAEADRAKFRALGGKEDE
jgi:tetratricopeptide (TPR) repeat protein/S1-C subfamily serine protease